MSYAALMMAAGLTGVYAETIPNFEVLTLVVFAAGVLLGAGDGALVGGVTMLTYSLLNPYGAAHPLVTASQVVGEVLVGLAGGVVVRAGLVEWGPRSRAAVLALAGALLTACYDLLTNVATGWVYGQMKIVLIGSIPFSLWHIGWNVLLFAAIGTPLVAALGPYRERLLSSR